jgi:uncharacterized membrane protein
MSDAPRESVYSKARIAGHPTHPMVVVFPIALFTSTVALLLAYVGTRDSFYYRAAMLASLSGVITTLIAMIPGAIDLLALPKPSRAREMAHRHARGALVVTGVYALAGGLLYRGWTGRVMVDGQWDLDATIPLALSVLGLVLLVSVAMAGWALVQRHHLGIKPARIHADRPSREPELDDLDDLDDEAAPALVAPAGLRPIRH